MLRTVLAAAAVGLCVALDPPVPTEPNPIYAAADYSTIVRSTTSAAGRGVLFLVSAPHNTTLKVAHLHGDANARGHAHGELLGLELLDFVENKLDAFYRSKIDEIPWATLPAWLTKLMRPLLKDAAPTAFKLALNYVYDHEKAKIPAALWDEVDGIAKGACVAAAAASPPVKCDEASLLATLRTVNMLPELIQMQCSMLGAW